MKKLLFILTILLPLFAMAQADSTYLVIDTASSDSIVAFDYSSLPEFLGGEAAMLKFIYDNLNYPVNAVKNKLEGTITVSFIIKEDGSVGNIYTIGKIFDKACAMEAIEVIKLLPGFIPANSNGRPVRMRMYIPVKFKLK
ncbi:MAG TPA: energy transducer TonB [Bacteroidia bacterium]|nr:energy transducer TonB [Bacteroidia bacterium]